jgi:hypothetical protein
MVGLSPDRAHTHLFEEEHHALPGGQHIHLRVWRRCARLWFAADRALRSAAHLREGIGKAAAITVRRAAEDDMRSTQSTARPRNRAPGTASPGGDKQHETPERNAPWRT